MFLNKKVSILLTFSSLFIIICYLHLHALALFNVKQPSDIGGHCCVHITEQRLEVLVPPFILSVAKLDTMLFLNTIFLISLFFMILNFINETIVSN